MLGCCSDVRVAARMLGCCSDVRVLSLRCSRCCSDVRVLCCKRSSRAVCRPYRNLAAMAYRFVFEPICCAGFSPGTTTCPRRLWQTAGSAHRRRIEIPDGPRRERRGQKFPVDTTTPPGILNRAARLSASGLASVRNHLPADRLRILRILPRNCLICLDTRRSFAGSVPMY